MPKNTAAVAVDITGDKELNRQLMQLGPKVTTRLARKSIRKVAKPVQQAAKMNAPKDDRELERSIVVRAFKRSRKNKGIVGVQVITDPTKQAPAKGAKSGKFFPAWIEFGAERHQTYGKAATPLPPRPFMRPAMDQSSSVVRRLFTEEMKLALEAERKKADDKIKRAAGLVGLGVGSAA